MKEMKLKYSKWTFYALLGVYTIIGFFYYDKYKDYLLPIFYISLLILFASLILDIYKYGIKKFKRYFYITIKGVLRLKQEEICILLPLNNSSKSIQEDCRLQIRGFGDHYGTLDKSNFIRITKYKFSFYDHGNCGDLDDEKKLKETVTEQLSIGTKYFICTMSAASEFLSREFPNLSKTYGRGDEILICTVASSKDIATNHQVLRLYIPAQQEINKIYEVVEDDGNALKKFFVIYYDSKHPQECAEDFLAKFGLMLNDNNSLKIKLDKENELIYVLNGKLEKIKQHEALCIFAYGHESYFPIISFLKQMAINVPIYTSSTFYLEEEEERGSEGIFNGLNITTIRPQRNTKRFTLEHNIVRYLFRHTIDKLILTLKDFERIPESKRNYDLFFKAWDDKDKTGKLRYKVTDNGDVEFELEALKV